MVGLTNKIATKVRIAAKVTPVSLRDPWEEQGFLAAASIVRASACTLSQSGRTSTGRLGTTFSSSDSDGDASTIWVEQPNQRTWLVSLGQPNYQDVVDWQLRFAVAPDGRAVEITTPLRIERNGTLVNKRAHSELRDLVSTALAENRTPSGKAEAEVAGSGRVQGLTMRPWTLLDGKDRIQARVTTTLAASEFEKAMNLVPFACVEKSAGRRVFQLVDYGGQGQPTAEVVAVDGAVIVRSELSTTAVSVAETLVLQRAVALRFSILGVITSFDANAELVAEDGLA